MKKIITWLLIASFLLTLLSSCNTQPSEEYNENASSITEQTKNVLSNDTSNDTFNDTFNDTSNDTFNDTSNDISNEEKYKPVLDIYKDVIINLDEQMNSKGSPYTEGTKEYEWWTAIIGAAASFHLSTNVPGYAFCDLNKNGNDEMLLLLDDYTVLAIFSFADGNPVLLDNYWNRKKCTIEQDGTIQVYGSGSADTSSFSIYEVAKNDKELVLLEEYGTDGHDPDTLELYFYKILNGTKTSITILEYTAAKSQGTYSSVEDLAEHTRENADFEFIPLGLEISYKRIFEKILNYEAKISSENKYLWEFLQYFGSSSMGDPNIIEICYLDMDGDGTAELLMRSNRNDNCILRYQSGTVCLYHMDYKSIDRVYEDGSYGWHSPTYLGDNSVCYGTSKVKLFTEEGPQYSSLYKIYDGENESYFMINGKFASKNELDALIESRKSIKEVTWTTYTLDPDKIPAKG